MITAEQILVIKKPEKMFRGSPVEIKKQYYDLAKMWHPDTNKEKKAGDVFRHVNVMYHEAVKKIETSTWEGSGILTVAGEKGEHHDFPYDFQLPFELGNYYVADTYVIYSVQKAYKDLFHNANKTISNFKFAADKMRIEMEKYLPKKIKIITTKDRFILQVKKDSGMLSLREVLNYYKTMDPKHVAWVQSSLHNITCYLEYAGIAHNNISVDNYFIDTEKHIGALLGGWWYTSKIGSPLKQVPGWVLNFLPWDVKTNKTASQKTDLELTRAAGRELLGDINGLKMVAVPKPMQAWLKSVSHGNAVEDYKAWGEVLTASFGKKRFLKMELDCKILRPI